MKILFKRIKEEISKEHFRVAIFGSARIKRNDKNYQMIYDLSKKIGAENIDIVTGGGPGIMEAANKGHRAGSTGTSHSFGLLIQLPKEQRTNNSLDIKRNFSKFTSRLDSFADLSNVFIVAPGGIGTTLELFYIWQLTQVKKLREEVPIILIGPMWSDLIKWVKKWQLKRRFIDRKDLDGIFFAKTPEEAMKIINKAHKLNIEGKRQISKKLRNLKEHV